MMCDRGRGIGQICTACRRRHADLLSPQQCQIDQWDNACTRVARTLGHCSALPRTADIRPLVAVGRHYPQGARIVRSRMLFASLDVGSGPRDMLHILQHGSWCRCIVQLGTVGSWCPGRKTQAYKNIRAQMDCARQQPPPRKCDIQTGEAYRVSMPVAVRMHHSVCGGEKWRFDTFPKGTACTFRGE